MKEPSIRVRRAGPTRLLITAGLVVAGVILVLAFLKGVLGISLAFFRTTLSLRPTTLQLADIQDLEFLITAEYFGEVIGTARDYFARRAIPQAEALAGRLFASARPEEEKLSPEESDILNAVRLAIIKRSGSNPGVVGRIGDMRRVVEFLRPEIRDGRFLPSFRELVLEELLAKRDIAYLARGSVQAGYNLKEITPAQYFYCPSTKTLWLNCRAQILSRQINPWFVYDPAANLYIKGFEIISQTNVDLENEGVYDFLKNIKEECQRRLEDDARREGIEAQARESAERTLESMLRLLKSDVQTVRIVSDAEFRINKDTCPESKKPVLSNL